MNNNTHGTDDNWNTSGPDKYPEPTTIVIDEKTDLSQVGKTVTIVGQPKRHLIGLVTFSCEKDFLEWQKKAPREIFEITPKALIKNGNEVITRIFVTYNAGVTDGIN